MNQFLYHIQNMLNFLEQHSEEDQRLLLEDREHEDFLTLI